jgi:hypothetical protein
VGDALGESGGAEALGGGDGVDRLEQAGLAGAVAAQDQVATRPRAEGQGLEVPEPVRFEGEEQVIRPASRQIRIGMMTQR